MAAPKGSRNAAAYQGAIVEETRKKIRDHLNVTVRSGVVFQNVSALADYLAPLVGRSANRLRRHLEYRKMLTEHLVKQKGAAHLLGERERNVHALQAKLLAANLEISNLRRDKDRLSILANRHLPSLNGMIEYAPKSAETSPSTDTSAEYRKAFEATAHVLATVLERIGGELGYEVDFDKERIIDRSARPDQQELAGPIYAQFFIKWLRSRPS